MTSGLRTYQQELYTKAREALKQHRSICIQLHTGGGKTVIFTAMCESVYGKDKRAWIIVPRKQLLRQASNHLRKWKVPHGIIDAGNQESRAYKIHICSKSTLERRWDKIKNFPDLIVIDEAHVNYLFQQKLIEHIPRETKIIGYTATPSRLDMKGLSVKTGGIYEMLIEGPSIPWLTQRGYLVPIRYFAPPLEGLDKIKTNRFGEFDSETLEELLQRRKIYGDMVSTWEKWGKDRSTLIFCRSVKSAQHAAERFQDKGYSAVAIDGSMSDKEVNNIIDKHKRGEIQIICNCLLVTYGVDIERIEYIGDISPTESLPMYCQKIGRGLRPFTDLKTGYKKQDLIYMDHVNQLMIHQDEDYPGIPIHYLDHIKWNFDGEIQKKKDKKVIAPKLCVHLDWMYCDNPHCTTCDKNPDKAVKDARQPMVIIDTELKETPKPVALRNMAIEDRREVEDKINNAVLEYRDTEDPGPIEKLLNIAEKHGYHYLWVYWKLVDKTRKTINVPLLHEICRIKSWKPGKVWFIIKELKKKGYVDYEKDARREAISG